VTSGYQYYTAEVAIHDHGLSETSQFYSLWSWTFRAVRLLALVHAAGSLLYNLKVNKPREKNCLQYFDAADQTPGMTFSASKTLLQQDFPREITMDSDLSLRDIGKAVE